MRSADCCILALDVSNLATESLILWPASSHEDRCLDGGLCGREDCGLQSMERSLEATKVHCGRVKHQMRKH